MVTNSVQFATILLHSIIFSRFFATVGGCGQFPFGQERVRRFTVTDFSIPAPMAYTEMPTVVTKVPTISPSEGAATRFIGNLVMQTVENVLEQQGRSAGLADFVISAILQQLTVRITYEPLKCNDAYTEATNQVAGMDNGCFIIMGTVRRSLCMMAGCAIEPAPMNLKDVPAKHFGISGTITTTNVIMANWSTEMWQSVLSRVARSLASGAFRENFGRVDIRITD